MSLTCHLPVRVECSVVFSAQGKEFFVMAGEGHGQVGSNGWTEPRLSRRSALQVSPNPVEAAPEREQSLDVGNTFQEEN